MLSLRSRPRALHPTDILNVELASWAVILDSLRANVFIASLELDVVFVNNKAAKTLQQIEPEIRSVFGLSVREILGGSIHRFHRDPGRVEKILNASGALPHAASFSFGEVTLSTQINAIELPDGQRIGYIVAWEEISQLRTSIDAVHQLSDRWQNAATTVEELGTSIQEISRSTSGAAGLADESTRNIASTRELVVTLAGAANEISSITQLIDAIADQTNLLALNATIEAARAGDAGRGFAVVAGEVKDLASNTSSATEQISRQVAAIQQSVTAVRTATEDLTRLIHQVAEFQNTIAAAVEEQAVVARELSGTIAEAAAFSDRVVSTIKL